MSKRCRYRNEFACKRKKKVNQLVIIKETTELELIKGSYNMIKQFHRCVLGFFRQNFMYTLRAFHNSLHYPTSEVFIVLLKRSASRSNTMHFSEPRTNSCVATSPGLQTANHD